MVTELKTHNSFVVIVLILNLNSLVSHSKNFTVTYDAGENSLTYSGTLAWKIPWTEEPGRLQSMGSLRVGLNWATSLSHFTFMHWRRKWQPTPVFLPGESQRWGSLVGCHLWCRTVGHDWSELAAAVSDSPVCPSLSLKMSHFISDSNLRHILFLCIIQWVMICSCSHISKGFSKNNQEKVHLEDGRNKCAQVKTAALSFASGISLFPN